MTDLLTRARKAYQKAIVTFDKNALQEALNAVLALAFIEAARWHEAEADKCGYQAGIDDREGKQVVADYHSAKESAHHQSAAHFHAKAKQMKDNG